MQCTHSEKMPTWHWKKIEESPLKKVTELMALNSGITGKHTPSLSRHVVNVQCHCSKILYYNV